MSAFESLIETPPSADAHDRALVSALDAAFAAGLVREPDLSVARAAAELAATAEQIGHALAAVRGMSFPEYVQDRRVEHAKRLLADPAEARTSMEAIGLLAGFGSRSAFYKVFGERAGMTPAAYRARTHENHVHFPDSGHIQR
jgi:AraC-like DNA-binding protein